MKLKPSLIEIDHHTMKLIVGVIAICLAWLTSIFSQTPLESISASYHAGGWSRDIFVGFLFAISAFLFAYNGRSTFQMVLTKIAAFAAIGVAIFPCSCGGHEEIIPYVHYVSAAVMFLILAVFCYTFFERARGKRYAQSKVRAYIYAICGLIIVVSIAVLALDFILGGAISSKVSRITFYCETTALIAFGVAWLTASRILPFITNKRERLSLSPYKRNKA
jgi:hypothetical protein